MRTAPEYSASEVTIIAVEKYARNFIVNKSTGCWDWLKKTNTDGYGRIKIGHKSYKAARLMKALVENVVSAGMVTDHLCRNRACVNPNHLEIVTNQTNLARSPLIGKYDRSQRYI